MGSLVRSFSPSRHHQTLAHKMVALPKLANCCACASLKTGTMVIGSLNLAASVIGIIASIGFMAGSTVLVDVVEKLLDQSVPGWQEDIDRHAIASGIFIFGGDYQGEVHYKREEREMLKA